MKNNLDIKEVENQFIITIYKNQLNADYILNLINWLQFISYNPKEFENYIDNIQQITKEKGAAKKSKKRVWNYSGSINLKYKLDNC